MVLIIKITQIFAVWRLFSNCVGLQYHNKYSCTFFLFNISLVTKCSRLFNENRYGLGITGLRHWPFPPWLYDFGIWENLIKVRLYALLAPHHSPVLCLSARRESLSHMGLLRLSSSNSRLSMLKWEPQAHLQFPGSPMAVQTGDGTRLKHPLSSLLLPCPPLLWLWTLLLWGLIPWFFFDPVLLLVYQVVSQKAFRP